VSFTIIQDTREKKPWSFGRASVEVKKLDTGDYSVKGLEDNLFIERKSSVHEVYLTLGKNWKRFEAELERSQAMKYRFMVLECAAKDIYYSAKFSKMSPDFIMGRLIYIQTRYNVNVVFAGQGDHVIRLVKQLMKNIARAEGAYDDT
jgi:ERCC4-type nuclease